jgi:transposase
MVTIGVDPHKDTHCGAAVNETGRQVATETTPARRDGFGQMLAWARGLDSERVWAVEDCRALTGGLERFLLDHGERVVRLAPHLMAAARQGVRERGKSDPVDAVAVARAALREGVENLPVAHLAGVELEIRLLGTHRERLVAERTRQINELRWQCHDLWPDYEIPPRVLSGPVWQAKLARRLAHATPSVRVQIARDLIRRVRELTRTITSLYQQLRGLVREHAPQLLGETGVGVLIAAKLIGEIAGIHRFTSDSKLARMAGCAPIPVSSGRTDRYRLDRGGNRQLNHAIHMLALTKMAHDPETIAYIARQRHQGKTTREAIRCLKRHLIRRVYTLLKHPNTIPITLCT